MNLNKNLFANFQNGAKSALRLSIGAVLLTLTIAMTSYGQAIYSDSWIDESNSNENGDGAFVTGRGVSEINYVDEDGVEVQTTITSPNGRTATSGAFGEVSAQADARLAWDWDDFVGNFNVRVERFSMCSPGGWMPPDDGILMIHGYNGRTGVTWWRPTGWQRCPRNSFVRLQSFPLGITYVAMQLVRPADYNGYGFLYEKVQPCDVYCNAPLTNRYPGAEPVACIQLQIPFGPLGCSRLVRVVRNVQACVCFDVGWN